MRTPSHTLLARTAGELMSRDLTRIPENMSMKDAARVLSQAQVSGAPVVDAEGRCVGVLSAADFVRLAETANGPPVIELPVTCGFQIKAPGPHGKKIVHCRLPFGVCALQRKGETPEEPEQVLCVEPHCVPTDWQVVLTERLPGDAVSRYMTADPVTVTIETQLRDLARKMLDTHIHRIIVVDEQGRPVGVVSSTDILAAVAYSTRTAVAVGG